MTEQKKESCLCPFCDSEMTGDDLPGCQVCSVRIVNCPQCQKPLARDTMVCSHCGAKAA